MAAQKLLGEGGGSIAREKGHPHNPNPGSCDLKYCAPRKKGPSDHRSEKHKGGKSTQRSCKDG